MSKNITVGLLGFGNVGKAVLEILSDNAEHILKRTGSKFVIKTVLVRNKKKARVALPNPNIHITDNSDDIINDKDIDVVVEVMGGEEPAKTIICDALKAKKHVVTANKEVLSKHKNEFFKLAKDNGVVLCYEAAVAGGIPLIRTLQVGLAANKINSLCGILNGTTNYILTKLEDGQSSYDEVLKKAQELGFAEADPAMDVSGLDAAYKLSILAAVAFQTDIQVEQLYYEGIEKITAEDLKYADELGFTIKLLAIGQRFDSGEQLFKVHPTLIQKTHPLAAVKNELNAIYVVGNFVGESMLSGKGAGGDPTGSAVVSDMIDISFDIDNGSSLRNFLPTVENHKLVPIEESTSQFFIRLLATDEQGTLEKITGIMSRHKVSISKLVQHELVDANAEIVLITHNVLEKTMTATLEELQMSPEVSKIISKIRVGIS